MPAVLEVADPGGGIRVLTVSHPKRKNALDDGLLDQLGKVLDDSNDVRAFLVRGAGDGVFSAGYDLTSLGEWDPAGPLPDEKLGRVLDKLMRHPAPSVAMLTGAAFGAGCELAMACDFRVGDGGAMFCMPPSRIGVVYALRGLSRVVERVGLGPARMMFLTGRRLGAEDALRLGLLDELAEPGRAADQAMELCEELAAGAPLAVKGLKRGLMLVAEGSSDAERADYEALRRASFTSEDAAEGRLAVLEKREPVFKGR